MKKKNSGTLLAAVALALVIFAGCGTEENDRKEVAKASEADLAAGFQLLETNCFTCHSPQGSHDDRIAPPMFAVKRHYVDENTTKEQFTKELTEFVLNPSEDISKMPGARDKFGLMPKMNFSEDQLRQIAAYIFDNELEEPEWFEKHYQEQHGKYMDAEKQPEQTPTEKGLSLAMATKSVLGKNLLGAINSQGTEAAVEFCNHRAVHLTDSMSQQLAAPIKRVSDRPRNPNNLANATELEYIAYAKSQLVNGEKITPKVQEIDGVATGYYPITTNKMCMQCHGQTDSQILPATIVKIDSLYPEDQAKGYGEDELRGIWVVEMK